MAGQQTHRRLVDLRAQHRLGAAGQQRHPLAPGSLGDEHLGPVDARRTGQLRRCHRNHPLQPPRHQPGERPAEPATNQRQAEQPGIGDHGRQQPAHETLGHWPDVGLLDMDAGLVDEMGVVHAGRTGGHARETGEATVDVLDHLGGGRLVALQHVLRQIDPPAGAVQFVTEEDVGRAGSGAEPAVDAVAQDVVDFLDVGIGEAGLAETGLHRFTRLRTCGRG